MSVVYSHDFGAGRWLGADTLLTGSHTPGTGIQLTHGWLRLHRHLDVRKEGPIGLTSKISILGDVAIGWAGRELAAQDALETLGSLYEDGLLRWEDIDNELLRASAGEPEESASFLVHRIIGDELQLLHYGSDVLERGLHSQHSFAIGTGAQGYLSAIENLYVGDPGPLNEGVAFEVYQAHSLCHSTHAFVMASEMQSQAGIADCIGGAFEVARLSKEANGNKRFEKIGDTSILYWPVRGATQADIVASEGLVRPSDVILPAFPLLICSLQYWNDIGILHSTPIFPRSKRRWAFILKPLHVPHSKVPTDIEISGWIESQQPNTTFTTTVVFGEPLQGDWFFKHEIREQPTDGHLDFSDVSGIWIDREDGRNEYRRNSECLPEILEKVRYRTPSRRVLIQYPADGWNSS